MTLKALSDRSMIIGLDESSQAAVFFGDRKVLSVHVVMASGIIPRVDHVVVSFGDGTTEIIKVEPVSRRCNRTLARFAKLL